MNNQPLVMMRHTTVSGITTSKIFYIHNDHQGTPQAMSNQAGTLVWKASYGPFGKGTPNQDVDGDGNKVTLNIRFPGQYYDIESGLHYNYFRVYDPESGRYITSDPIGLRGGLNTFGYAIQNPLNYYDSQGAFVQGKIAGEVANKTLTWVLLRYTRRTLGGLVFGLLRGDSATIETIRDPVVVSKDPKGPIPIM